MLVTIKRILFLPNTIFFSFLLLFLISFTPILAADVLTNGVFNGGTTGWTLSVVSGVAASNVYDSSIPLQLKIGPPLLQLHKQYLLQ